GLNEQQCGIGTSVTNRPPECNPGGGGSLQMPNTVPDNGSTVGAGMTPGDIIDAEWLLAQNPGLTMGQITEALFPRLARPVDMSGERERGAVVGSLEWRPSHRIHFYLASMYSRAKHENDRLDASLVGRTCGPAGFIPTNMQLAATNVVTSATLVNSQFLLEARP